MKKLLKKVIVFLLPVLLVLLIVPINKRLYYQEIKNDCFGHGIWIYDRIFNNPDHVDIAFIGSSKTINCVDDKLIENQLGKDDLGVVNFGYCRLGRNLSYVLIKDILKTKKPKLIIIEVREDEDRYSHPIFPYIAETDDVILANPFFNKDIISDIFIHVSYKIALIQDIIYRQKKSMGISKKVYGFTTRADTATSEYLKEIKTKNSILKSVVSTIERNFHAHFARTYLKKIGKICSQRGIKLCFMYLPVYSSQRDKPAEYKTYEKYGAVICPPEFILQNNAYWYDEDHMNKAGAKAISAWLAKQITICLDQ